jgi:hypothetical protein
MRKANRIVGQICSDLGYSLELREGQHEREILKGSMLICLVVWTDVCGLMERNVPTFEVD